MNRLVETDPAGPVVAEPPASARTAASATVSRRRWLIHLALVSAYLLIVAFLGWSRDASGPPALSTGGRQLLLVCAIELGIFGLVLGLACLASRASRDDLLLRWRGPAWIVPLGIGYSVALRLLLAMVVLAVSTTLVVARLATSESISRFAMSHAPNVHALVDVPALRSDPLYYWLTLTLVSFVVAGLREELWRAAFLAGLRTLWPRWFGSRVGQIGAVLVAAVLFGVGHVAMGPAPVLMAGILGFGLGAIMVLHRSIWPAVIAHGTFNATSFALIPWAMERLALARQVLGP